MDKKMIKLACEFWTSKFIVIESKNNGFQTLGTLDLKRPYGEFEGFGIFQKIASEIDFGFMFS